MVEVDYQVQVIAADQKDNKTQNLKEMKKILAFISGFVLLSEIGFSQNEIDALRYSQLSFGGTAKYMGMSGAYTALGGDESVLSSNPAGIGLYKKSEITFSPSIYKGETTSKFFGSSQNDFKFNFNFSNLGFVGTYLFPDKAKSSGWSSINFGFGYNRLNNYHNRVAILGTNPLNSIRDQYMHNAIGNTPKQLDAFSTSLAYNTWLIDTIGNETTYVAAFVGAGEKQQKTITSVGAMNELTFSLGGNYNDMLYIGGTIGVPSVRYIEESTYKEMNHKDTTSDFKSITIYDNLKTTGTGFNAKLGFIYRPFDWIRIGGAVHSPTFFSMHDGWTSTFKTSFANETFDSKSPDGSYDYELTTPMRLLGGLAFVIGKYGVISADYEYVDYSEARLRASDNVFGEVNDAISQNYRAAGNLRLGAELNLAPFSIRGGVSLYDSPFKNNLNDGNRNSISLGFGMRQESYFVDIAYVYTSSKDKYYMYDLIREPAYNSYFKHNIVATLGFRF